MFCHIFLYLFFYFNVITYIHRPSSALSEFRMCIDDMLAGEANSCESVNRDEEGNTLGDADDAVVVSLLPELI